MVIINGEKSDCSYLFNQLFKYLSDIRLGYQSVDRKEVITKIVNWLNTIIISREQKYPFTETPMSKELIRVIQFGSAVEVWEEIKLNPKQYIGSVDPETLTSFIDFFMRRQEKYGKTYYEQQENVGIVTILKKYYHDEIYTFDYMSKPPILPSQEVLDKIIQESIPPWLAGFFVSDDKYKTSWYADRLQKSFKFKKVIDKEKYIYKVFSEPGEPTDINALINSAASDFEKDIDYIIKWHNQIFRDRKDNKIKIDHFFASIIPERTSAIEKFYVNFGRKLNFRLTPPMYLERFLSYLKIQPKIICNAETFQAHLKKSLKSFVWFWHLPSAFVSNGISDDVLEKSRKNALCHGVTTNPVLL